MSASRLPRLRPALAAVLALGLCAPALTSCRSTYYRAMEWFGQEKRDLLADRVQDAREDQAAAKKQFTSALERFTELVGKPEGGLAQAYERSKSDLEKSEARATAVRDRVRSVETVADDLFDEWRKETKSYTSDALREKSLQQLEQTKDRYAQMLAAMKRAEASMEPVLAVFRDNTLFLKHNLNAQAVASLGTTVGELERDVQQLVQEMEASIAEADRFIAGLSGS